VETPKIFFPHFSEVVVDNARINQEKQKGNSFQSKSLLKMHIQARWLKQLSSVKEFVNLVMAKEARTQRYKVCK
jgi:hypothetical protein